MTAEDIKAKARSRLASTLRKLILGENPFPVVIGLPRPKNTGDPSEILRLKSLLRSQSKEILGHGPKVTYEMTNTRHYGSGELPGEVSFQDLDDLTIYIGKKSWADRVLTHANALVAVVPEARNWASLHLDELGEDNVLHWAGIGAVVSYLARHPLPGVYARQLPVAVHTKFIEEHSSIIISILVQVAPHATAKGKDWKTRLGLSEAPVLVEGRFLDPTVAPHLPNHFLAPLEDWERCDLGSPRIVLITENRTTFLTLPNIPGVLAFMGMGYAVHRLARLKVVSSARIIYWGDIDAHGFEILAQLRRAVAHTVSVMMNQESLDAFKEFEGSGNQTLMDSADVIRQHLNPAEIVMFNYCWDHNKRLEQERLAQSFIDSWLSKL